MNLRSYPGSLLLLGSSLLAGERTRTHDLIDQLGSSKHTERMAAEKELLALGARAHALLKRALARHPAGNVRARCAAILGRSRETALTPDLLNALADKELLVRRAAVEALGLIGGKEASKALLKCLTDKDALIRADAVLAIGRQGKKSAVKPLIRSLGDDEAHVRAAAAFALGAFDDPRVIAALIEGLDDEDENVRAKSLLSLKRLTKQTFGFNPKAPAAERERAVNRWLAWWKAGRE